MARNIVSINLHPSNFFCVYCALINDDMVEADKLIYNEGTDMIYPLCYDCEEVMLKETKFFSVFSIN